RAGAVDRGPPSRPRDGRGADRARGDVRRRAQLRPRGRAAVRAAPALVLRAAPPHAAELHRRHLGGRRPQGARDRVLREPARPGAADPPLRTPPAAAAATARADRYYGSMTGTSPGEPLRSPAALGVIDPVRHFRDNPFPEAHAFEPLVP